STSDSTSDSDSLSDSDSTSDSVSDSDSLSDSDSTSNSVSDSKNSDVRLPKTGTNDQSLENTATAGLGLLGLLIMAIRKRRHEKNKDLS
ncbi:LPXTG cell wall anchor domain-containing protein, partial [Leuconostoc citreum]